MKRFTSPHIILMTLIAIIALATTSCIEDDFSTSPNDVLSFSTDTVRFDTVITSMSTPTKQLLVYNKSKKMLNIESIRIAGVSSDKAKFFLNVDGVKGTEFHNVEIRGEDSIYVFIESQLQGSNTFEPVEINDRIEFVTNGVTQKVTLNAWGQDVIILRDDTISTDTHLTANRPYLIYDTLTVAQGATLTIDPGATLLFHDKAWIKVLGTLKAIGSQDKPITMRGDRLDHVVGEIGFDIMSGQWDGIIIYPGSVGNEMQYVNMRGSYWGCEVFGDGDLSRRTLHIFNSVLHNATNVVLYCTDAWVDAEGTEFSDAGYNVLLVGGKSKGRYVNCTFANYYLFKAIEGTIVLFDYEDNTKGNINCSLENCILYGLCSDIYPGDLTGTDIYIRNCLFKADGEDDANFTSCVWKSDPLFYVQREKYIFDYRLMNGSGAIGRGNRDYIPESARYDRYGQDRFASSTPDLGAYVWVEAAEGSE